MKKIKLSVNCWSEELFYELLNTNVHKIIFGIKGYSCRFNNYINLEQLRRIVEHKQDKKISICLNNIYHENDVERLEKLLIELSKIEIDEIIFHDYAVPQIALEQNLHFNLNYCPETINTNIGQIDFFIKNGFKSFTIARELLLHEVKELAANKQSLEVEMQVHGFTFFMHSNWSLISNYKKHLDMNHISHDKNIKFYEIREELRVLPNLIYEDYSGTHMFSGFVLYTANILDELKDIDYLKIDPIFRTKRWTLNVIKIYSALINGEISKEKATSLLRSLEPKYQLSNSFMGNIKDMPHIEKGVDNE